jgi:hypothetical protein
VLRQGFNVDPLLQRQADCISTMTYNEYWQVIDAGIAETSSSPSSTRIRASPRWKTGSMCWKSGWRIRLRRQDGPLRARLDARLGMGRGEPRGSRR